VLDGLRLLPKPPALPGAAGCVPSVPAYNPCMLHALNDLLAPAAMERLTLVVNHVVGSEPAATDRLRPHAGRSIVVVPQGWPGLLPPLPALAFRVTPAGLLEWCGLAGVDAPDLSLRLDASNPARLALQALAGETPQVQIDGDAQFAGDINWLLVNLRWDVAADLERLFGPGPAQALHRSGAWLGRGLKAAFAQASAVADRLRPRRQ
jgi:ubiquinone biosynthesis accessory factor UbiJ